MAVDPTFGGMGSRANETANNRFLELATGDDAEAWRSRSRIVLSPIAAPSIMGLFGFAIATMMVGAWQAGWYGNPATPLVLWPFAFFVGGVLQTIAAIYSFRARDGVAVAVHTVWGAFWMAWGILQLLVATNVMSPISFHAVNTAFGFWFIGLCAVTLSAALASLAQSVGIFLVLATLAAGSGLTATGFWIGNHTLLVIGGWLFLVSAACAWYVATAMMMEHSFGRTIIPLFKYGRAANLPGGKLSAPITFPQGMPGSRVGQ